jgi:hypothetical protein
MDVSHLKYNEVSFKSAHNSEQLKESIAEQLHFDPENPWQGGCSGLELDIVQSRKEWAWSVSHGGFYRSKAPHQLSAYLEALMEWASGQDRHRVITLHLDIKGNFLSDDEFPEAVDEYLSRIIPADKFFRPASLLGGEHLDLVSGARANGWPTLAELESKFVVVFTGNGRRKAAYAAHDPASRLCFADRDLHVEMEELPDLKKGHRLFLNFHLRYRTSPLWHNTLQALARQPGFVTRGYVINREKLWDRAMSAALNILATDRMSGYPWCGIGREPFAALRM